MKKTRRRATQRYHFIRSSRVTDHLDILCAGGFRAAMEALAPRFEAAHGLRLALTFATPAATRTHLEAGFPFHAGVVVASPGWPPRRISARLAMPSWSLSEAANWWG